MSAPEELLPCPFCGGPATLDRDDGTHAGCASGECATRIFLIPVAMWNKRASPAPQASVPREPTEAMVQAAYDISNEGRYFIDRLPRYWRAMYDAAPSADAGGRELRLERALIDLVQLREAGYFPGHAQAWNAAKVALSLAAQQPTETKR